MRRVAIDVRGVVQGVGFRPFVHRLAVAHRLTGFVRNDPDAVRVEAQGDALDAFVRALHDEAPPAAGIRSIELREMALGSEGAFSIVASEATGPRSPTLPADLAPCAACLDEIVAVAARRHAYPFTNCTLCGPRHSIVHALPWDRARTTMHAFSMCGDCRREYEDPLDRRFHAEPIACPSCGPKLVLLDRSGVPIACDDPLARVADALREGAIVAIKGVGGYQILCDARDDGVVGALRTRKRRPAKPFAVMFPSLDALRECAVVDVAAARTLASPAAPIVLVRTRECALAPAVAPTTRWIGAMLPSSPLHRLLLDALGFPVVCTSGNLAEEPIAIDDGDAIARLAGVVDVFLAHDRVIARPVDDALVRIGPTGVEVLRRARGFAPLPLARSGGGPTVLAVGGHLKSTITVAVGDAYVVSQHLGDLDTVDARSLLARTVGDLLDFLGARPDVVACDLHPEYASTLLAEHVAGGLPVPVERVQHHHAHVAACIAEHGIEGPVLGFAWDGTGLGDDGTIWGGETLLCDGARVRRVAHLRPYTLPGADRAAREPRRSAFAILHAIFGDGAWHRPTSFSAEERRVLSALLHEGGPQTTSMGRLFDAVAFIAGLRDRCSFEGEAAMLLEHAADGHGAVDPYPLPIRDDLVIDWERLVRAIVDDCGRSVPVGEISARFHEALAQAAVDIAARVPAPAVVLSGGCFQNLRLATRVRERLEAAGHRVYSPSSYPPNDGGLSLGQAWVVSERWRERGRCA